MRRIDISGLGKLRVTVQLDGGETDGKSTAACAGLATLQPVSTVWPRLMMLLLLGVTASLAENARPWSILIPIARK